MDSSEIPQPVPNAFIWDKVLPGPGILLSRALLYLIFLLFVSAGVWAAITEMDVVVHARGRLVVRGEPVRVSVQEPGLVIEVPFRIGDHVDEGAVLLRLDSFKYRTDADQTRKEIAAQLVEAGRLRESAREVRAAMRATERELDIARRAAAIVADQLKRYESLADQQIAAAVDVQQKALELNAATAKSASFETALRAAENDAADKERRALEARARADTLAARLAQLGGLEQRMTLRAPVAGTITQLAVLHAGSVIEPDQAAAVIAPDRLPLEAQLQIPNASMRRLQNGQAVRMRVDAFPYQDFGDVEGQLARIEPDADAAGNYRAWATLARTRLSGPRGVAPLQPGLLLDADIIVDRRTVMDFTLRPFRRLGEPIRVSD